MENCVRKELYKKLLCVIDRSYDLMSEYDSIPRKHGEATLYQAESQLIQYIGKHPDTTITDIAAELKKTTSAASQMIRKLRSKGWVLQNRDEDNNRIYHLNLTEAGWKIFEEHEKFEQFCYGRMFEKLEECSDEELQAFCKVLKHVNEAFVLDIQDSYKL